MKRPNDLAEKAVDVSTDACPGPQVKLFLTDYLLRLPPSKPPGAERE